MPHNSSVSSDGGTYASAIILVYTLQSLPKPKYTNTILTLSLVYFLFHHEAPKHVLN